MQKFPPSTTSMHGTTVNSRWHAGQPLASSTCGTSAQPHEVPNYALSGWPRPSAWLAASPTPCVHSRRAAQRSSRATTPTANATCVTASDDELDQLVSRAVRSTPTRGNEAWNLASPNPTSSVGVPASRADPRRCGRGAAVPRPKLENSRQLRHHHPHRDPIGAYIEWQASGFGVSINYCPRAPSGPAVRRRVHGRPGQRRPLAGNQRRGEIKTEKGRSSFNNFPAKGQPPTQAEESAPASAALYEVITRTRLARRASEKRGTARANERRVHEGVQTRKLEVRYRSTGRGRLAEEEPHPRCAIP